MREIKFRAKIKNLHADKWVYGYLVSETYINEKNILGYTPVRKETVGQYTGLKDKNGKEIYEGDIVKSYYYINTPNGEQERFNQKVINYNDVLCEYNINAFENLEVIGNIYDNPELLEE